MEGDCQKEGVQKVACRKHMTATRRFAAVGKLKEALHNYAILSTPDEDDNQTDARRDHCDRCSRLMRQAQRRGRH